LFCVCQEFYGFNVNDILIVYDENGTNVYYVLDCFNKITPKLKLTLERETDHKTNFLGISIYGEKNRLLADIYRKPTSTDIIIPNDSCHPKEHKWQQSGTSTLE